MPWTASRRADVPWPRVAALRAINRLGAPGSELAIGQRWHPSTAPDDLPEIEEGRINDTRLYRCPGHILPHQTKLERHLKERCGALLGAGFEVLLYGPASTHVEGAAGKNPMVRRGYSRDHRPGCEQTGDCADCEQRRLPAQLRNLRRQPQRRLGHGDDPAHGGAQVRQGAQDPGARSRHAGGENLAAIRRRDGQYPTGTPRGQMKRFEAELLKEDWTQVRPEVAVKKVSIPDGGPPGEREGEPQPVLQQHGTALKGLEKAIVTGRLKDRNKMERRLGRIQARHPPANDLYELGLRDTAEGVRLTWQMKEDRKQWRESREGAYLLRGNLTAETAEEMWSKCMRLTEAEVSFRGLKSGLSVRPLFHQLEPRKSSRHGGVPGLCSVGDAETSAEAAACDCPEAIAEWR
jgi:hypothetical protein